MALIWNDEELPCEAHVIDWRSSGLQFKPGANGCHPRRKTPQLMLVHFTGAENPPPVMFANMRQAKSGKSVEFAMDFHGQIWQFCDPAKVYCAHAKGANVFSFGIEIQNRGVPSENRVINKRFPRGTYIEQMPWGRQAYVFFTASQLEALEHLIVALANAKVLKNKLAIPATQLRKRIPRKEWSALTGIAGHYHCDTDPGKIDPGPHVFEVLFS